MGEQTSRVASQSVILLDDEVLMARTAVRKYLTKARNNYLSNLRKGQDHYAATNLRRFDEYLDLYERLGGDPAEVIDPESAPVALRADGSSS